MSCYMCGCEIGDYSYGSIMDANGNEWCPKCASIGLAQRDDLIEACEEYFEAENTADPSGWRDLAIEGIEKVLKRIHEQWEESIKEERSRKNERTHSSI